MRIAICGVSNISKIEFINAFLQVWPMYKKSEGKYKQIFTMTNVNITENEKYGSKKIQSLILNNLIDETMQYKKTDNIIHDYSVLDNLAYTMWLASHDYGNIDDAFVQHTMALNKQALHFYDIIFYLPKLAKYDNNPESFNEEEQMYFEEYDNLLRAIYDTYISGQEQLFEFSSVDGAPAMIEIFGNTDEKIQMAKLYLNEKGQSLGNKPEDSLLQLPNLGLDEAKDVDKLIKQVQK